MADSMKVGMYSFDSDPEGNTFRIFAPRPR